VTDPTHLPNDSSIAACTSAQLRNKVHIGYNGTPQIHLQNCPFPFDDNHRHLIHPSLDRSHSPFQTASGSNQPFCHSTLSGQTDRQTHRHFRRQVSNNSAYAHYIDRERRANNVLGCVVWQRWIVSCISHIFAPRFICKMAWTNLTSSSVYMCQQDVVTGGHLQ